MSLSEVDIYGNFLWFETSLSDSSAFSDRTVNSTFSCLATGRVIHYVKDISGHMLHRKHLQQTYFIHKDDSHSEKWWIH